MNPTILVLAMLFIILISMQYTLNKILFELRQMRTGAQIGEFTHAVQGDFFFLG
jgi:hypothetical protein